MRTGGQILVDQLKINGVERITCVPGESYLAALDAMVDSDIDVMICRHEGGAAIMAEAYGKLTGKPGICFVTRGPGATNAAHGVHIAHHDSTPMILCVGQIERGFKGRGAFQELDYEKAFGGLAKWVVEIDDPKRIPELIQRAFTTALSGRPGPVVVSLPEDMLSEMAEAIDRPCAKPAISWVDDDYFTIDAMLSDSKSPILIAGGTGWTREGCAALAGFAELRSLPVVTEFRRTALMDALHPCFAGDLGFGPNPKLVARIKAADVVILLGARLSEVPSQAYTLLSPAQKIIHIYPDPAEIGRVYAPEIGVVATPDSFARTAILKSHLTGSGWAGQAAQAHQDYLDWSETPAPIPGDFQYGEVMVWLRNQLPDDTIICNGAGNYAIWVHRYWRHRQPFTQLAPTSGSVGYSVPAGVMAKRQCPDQTVVVFAGDGCFLMHGNELATAVQYDIPVIIIIIDNAMYGTIRMHQERTYPHRVIGTDLKNPDFAAMARAFGAHGESVHKTEEFVPAFERAIASGKPAIIHCFLDPNALTPSLNLRDISPKS